MDFPLASTYGERSALFLQSADDYHRQRHRINKKLNKLRRNLNITTKDTKNYSEKNKISTICAENYDMEPLFGDVLLYQIERDLLYAQETKLLLDVHISKSKERFLISKYKKALKNAKQLISVISNENDKYKILEILTYTAIIEGSLAICKKKYKISLYSFSIARCCLQFLYSVQELPNEYTKELYYDIIDLIVDPALKVSAIQTKSNRRSDLIQLSKEEVFNNELIPYLYKGIEIILNENSSFIIPTTGDDEIKLIEEISWGSYNARIKSEDISLAIMKVNEELKKIVDIDTSSYDSSLILYQDAINLHLQEMERNNDENEESENQEQYIILTYLKYNYLLLRIRRDITIMKDLDNKSNDKKSFNKQKLLELWRDVIKVNDTIISSVNEIKELPGIANDDEIMDLINSLDLYFQIKKQMILSKSYLISNHYVKSLAIISNCKKLTNQIKPFNIKLEGNLPNNEDIQIIKELIKEEESKVFILASYFKDNGENLSVGSKYLIDNVSKFPEFSSKKLLENVSPLKVEFEPVNVKPVLFDIAYNYIKYDGKQQENVNSGKNNEFSEDEPIREGMEKKKGGFFGLFGR